MKIVLATWAACVMTASIAAAADPSFDGGVRLFSAGKYRQAEPLLASAASRGDPRAQALMGRIHDEGLGVKRDPQAAARWFGQAAAQGHRASQFALGGLYENGDGLPRDERRASQLFELSARQGYAPAQFAIGLNYDVGRGVARNRQTALYWLDKAARQGDDDARVVGVWLRRPGTPVFRSERELTSYVASRMPQQSLRPGGAPSGRSIQDRQGERLRCRSVSNINDRQACMNNAG